MNKNSKTFVIYIITLKFLLVLANMIIYLLKTVQITILKQDKTLINILSKYINYANIFLFDLIIKLSKKTSINKNTIQLKKDK